MADIEILERPTVIKEKDMVAVNECKVIFLGDPDSGKTYLIRRLLNNGEYLGDNDRETAFGLEITASKINLADSDVVVNYWDFGSHEIMHCIHNIFLTKGAAYVVFLDASNDNLTDERAQYWLENIKVFAPEAPVLVVINKTDQNEQAYFEKKDFIATYGNQVKAIIQLSAKKDEEHVFLNKLQDSIKKIVMELPIVSKRIPRSWKNLMENIRQMPDFYLTIEQFFEKCELSNIENYKEIQDELINLFQVTGVSFCFNKDRAVADYILLNPMWLLNALYTIIHNGEAIAKNGFFTQNNLYDLLEKDVVNGITVNRAIPNLQYRGFEVSYILGVIRMFDLSYSLEDGSEFFPMLLDRRWKKSLSDVPENALKLILRYSYLPTNVIHRLIVENRSDIDEQNVWYTGAVFKNKTQNQTAFVFKLGNDLHIYVYGEEEYYNLNEYLTPITNKVNYINKDMGLSAVQLMSYRNNGIEVEIPADIVKENLQSGKRKYYIDVLDMEISLEDFARRYFNFKPLIEVLNTFFEKYNNKCPHFTDLEQFINEENSDEFQNYLHDEMGDLFRFAEAHDKDRRTSEAQELLELLWKLYLIDSNRIKKVNVTSSSNVKPRAKIVDGGEEKALSPSNNIVTQEIGKNKDITKQHKPESSDLERATELVLQDFEKWWEKDADREGLTFSIEKHTVRQHSGTQFGYDVGLNTRYGGLKYRLRFECKNYTSNISDSKQGEISELPVSRYAYNLLEYYMECRECKSEINMRWVLICPFGGLQNDFPERLFEHWNDDHTFIKIYAIMENGPTLTCKDFLSANDEAYRLIYNKTYDGNLTKYDVFKKLKDTIIGVDDVREEALKRLKEYKFWKDYGGHKGLLPVPDKKNQNALDQILYFLQRYKDSADDESRTLFVIGEYGTGKSWLCYQAIEQVVLHPNDFPFIPFYLRLKELSQNKDLEDKTQYEYIMKSTLKKYFKKYDKWAGECVRKDYRPIFFLDGFDEVLSGLSATDKKIDFLLQIIYELKAWYEKYENEREIQKHTKPLFIITSRESDFEIGMKSDDFQHKMEMTEILELGMCSVEDVKKKWNKQQKEDQVDRSWIFQLEQSSALFNIIRRPVFYKLCTEAFKDIGFKQIVDRESVDEVDVLDMLFNNELQKYAHGEGLDKKEIRREIYRCAVECSKDKKSRVVYKGKSINQIIHVGLVKIRKDRDIEKTCWVSFEHNIVREYLTARYLSECLINCSPEERNDPMRATFVQVLQELSLTPETIKFLLLCIEKVPSNDTQNKGEKYKQQLKEWLCNEEIKKSNSRLPARLLEILLQPGYILSGTENDLLDLSGIYASDLCLWNCKMQHVNLSKAKLRNWQMINMELDDVDLRDADMEGLRIAPDKPVSSFCYWKDTKEWHVAALHENGQLMQYNFPDDSWNHYSIEILSKMGVKDGLFRFRNKLLLHSVKKLYDVKENELYHIRSSNELEQIVTTTDFCGFIMKQRDDCQAIVFHRDIAPITFSFGKTEPKSINITENGRVLCLQNDSLNFVYENGEVKRICKWETDYECFATRLEPVKEACIYIKCGNRLIKIALDEEMNEKTSCREELLIKGDMGKMRELRVLNEIALVAVGKDELYILSLDNKGDGILNCRKLKTSIFIKNSLLENEDGSNCVQDGKAYELLRSSMC